MSELLSSLKADLTSRRMLPVLIVAALALLGALAYVALAGKAGAPPSSEASAPAHEAPLPGPAVASAPANPNAAVSETTIGSSFQHKGAMRNPFTPLVAPLPVTSASTTGGSSASTGGSGSSGSSGSSSTGEGSSGGGASGGSTGSGTGGSEGSGPGGSPQPPSGSIALYHVDLTLQQLNEAGEPVGQPQTFKNVTHLQPLPSKHKALLAPVGVTDSGKAVAFTLLREAILHGKARCVPSPEDCQGFELRLHAGEELQFPQNDGSMLYYKLTITKIERVSADGSAARAAAVKSSAAGKALIARMRLSVPSSSAFAEQLGTIVGVRRR
jgi:hypothetical protein